ncbi:hypothetical protein [Streptomyces buecherae]|uniref:hypothetical protein n=1 Tax=Streptomyces buecherae TaxID=2763006 RepID=UPI0036A83C49
MTDTTDGWSVYPHAALRMAGFPFSWWEQLPPPPLLAAQAELDARWTAARQHRAELLTAAFPAAVDAAGDPATRRVLSKCRTAVGRNRPVAAPEAAPACVRDALREWNGRLEAVREAESGLAGSWTEDVPALRRRLHALAREEPLLEAVGLLSPSFGEALQRFAHAPLPPTRTSRVRSLEHRFLLYLQRLVAKNETNSYFGPIGAAAFCPDAPVPLRVDGTPGHGPPVVFSSPRTVRDLAELIAAEPEFAHRLVLRRSPMFTLAEGRLTHLPSGRSTRVSPSEAALWSALRPGADAPPPPVPDPSPDRLLRIGALVRQVPLDLWTADPLASLETWLRDLGPRPAAREWLARLGELRADLRAFAAASGSGARRAALGRAEDRVAALTGGAPRQGGGRMYADRSVLFEERENRLSLTVGGPAAAQLPADLAPVLTYWAAVACQRHRQHQRAAAALYDREWPGRPAVPLPAFLRAAAALPAVSAPTPAETRMAALVGESTDEVRLDPRELTSLADAVAGPVFTSVDLLLAASDAAAAFRGDQRWVLGEAHAGHLLSVFPTDHFARLRDPGAHTRRDSWLFGALQRTGRRAAWLVTGRDTKIFQYRQPAVAVQLRPHLPDHAALPASQLTVRRKPSESDEGGEGDSVTLWDSRGPLWLLPAVRPATDTFDPLAALSFPAVQSVPFGLGPLRPRVVVGRTVAQRATWRVPAPAIGGLRDAEQLLAARAFRFEHGMPELVFVRLPWEPKPTLLDFRNPLSVGAFAGLLRHAPNGADRPVVTFSEMLPGPRDLWLADGRTFEVRALAVRG